MNFSSSMFWYVGLGNVTAGGGCGVGNVTAGGGCGVGNVIAGGSCGVDVGTEKIRIKHEGRGKVNY